jgi:hypothetical protein
MMKDCYQRFNGRSTGVKRKEVMRGKDANQTTGQSKWKLLNTILEVMMKAVLFFLMFTALAAAGNPDERTSLTFTLGGDFLSGDYTLTDDFGITAKQDTKFNSFGGRIGLIVPQSENVSLLASMSYSSSKSEGEATSVFFDSEHKVTGFSLSAGIKVYFSQSK